VVGLVAALAGPAVGLASWIALVPLLEEPFGHRIDRFGIPWWLVAAAVLLAVITATVAAWWPARAMARISVTHALSGRPPQPKATRWSMTVATAMTAAGMLVLVLAGPDSPVLVVVGSLSTIIGVLLFSPLIVRMSAGPAARLPVAARLALRDVARYQARSGAALAAVSLAFGMAASITIIASAEEYGRHEGNLAAEQLMVRVGDPEAPILPPDFSPFVPDLSVTDLRDRQLRVDEIAALLDAARVIALDVAFDPHLGVDERFDARSAVTLAEFVSQGPRPGYPDLSLLYVASPEMLGHYGIDLSRLDPSTEVLTTESGDLWFSGLRREPGVEPPPVVSPIRLTERYTSLPGSFITSAALQEHGWGVMRSGWLVEAAGPVTGAQVAAARGIAARSGLTIEFRDEQEDLLALRFQATAGGSLVALAVIAMTVGLIRAEAARDLRTLTATGATSATRRALTATTAAALAVLGAVVGISGAYAVLCAGYLDASSLLSSIPWMHLGLTMLGAPFAAGLMGWLMAGGEQRALTRQPIE
jgi:putative ABC transport system permease protein